MTLSEITAGDVLKTYHDNGTGAGLIFARVVRVNRSTVTVETESGATIRAYPSVFTGKVSPGEWSPWNPEGK